MDRAKDFPLLVKVQSIDLQSLDFKTGTSVIGAPRSKHVTCLEASNLYVFVGCTSGTVYVFARDTLDFRFMIPFKGGKVCLMACAENETDIAVASIRGNVSLYRISPQGTLATGSSSPPSFMKHLYTVPHHVNNEVTELHWSPNGKFLFIGDGQGTISQVDVGCLEDFPRPVPSRVILVLSNRVIQVDFLFPYLAISTVMGVFLCNVESEAFTRIQLQAGKDIRASGISFLVFPRDKVNGPESLTASTSTSQAQEQAPSNLRLFICEMGTNVFYSCNMEGALVNSVSLNMSSSSALQSAKLFDPRNPDESLQLVSSPLDSACISFGKLFVTDSDLIITSSPEHIYVIDPFTMSLVLWNDQFHRINNVKILSNYLFIWHSSKLDIVSLTQFRSYGDQLRNASLISVLEYWIQHSLQSIGWVGNTTNADDDNQNITDDSSGAPVALPESSHNINLESENLFKCLLGSLSEDDDFSKFVAERVSFIEIEPIPRSSTPPPPIVIEPRQHADPYTLPLYDLIDRVNEYNMFFVSCTRLGSQTSQTQLQDSRTGDSFTEFELSSGILDAVSTFYKEISLVLPILRDAIPLSLTHLMEVTQEFLDQPRLILLRKSIKSVLAETFENSPFDQLVPLLIKEVDLELRNNWEDPLMFRNVCKTISGEPVCTNFNLFLAQSHVRQWFQDIGIPSKEIQRDACISDIIMFLSPLITPKAIVKQLGNYGSENFFSWLLLTSFNSSKGHHDSVLKTVFSYRFPRIQEPNMPREVLSNMYRDLMNGDITFLSRNLHQFITLFFFTIESEKACDDSEGYDLLKTLVLSLLISCFPLHHLSKGEIRTKMMTLCGHNHILLGMFQQGFLRQGDTSPLCSCGVPVKCGQRNGEVERKKVGAGAGILTNTISSSTVLEETVFILLAQGLGLAGTVRSPAYEFAMQRSLYGSLLAHPLLDMTDQNFIQLVLRTGSETLLEYLEPTSVRIDNLIMEREKLMETQNCRICRTQLIMPQHFNSISLDSIGKWILRKTGSLDKSIKLLSDSMLNTPGIFSIEFYDFACTWTQGNGFGHKDPVDPLLSRSRFS